MKICTICKKEKDISDFPKGKNRKDGTFNQCKKCRQEYNKQFIKNNPEKAFIYNNRWYYNNRDKKIKFAKIYRNIPSVKEKRKQQIIIYRTTHKEEIKKTARIYLNNKLKNDISFKISCCLRNRMNKVLKGNYKSAPTMKLIGCSIEFLKGYLQGKFTEGMTWENHGEWHIDHIWPCANFDLSDPEQQKQCFHYTNLQPLWAKDNLSKGART